MDKLKNNYVDKIGIFTSGICAVHCAALPIFLYFGVIGSLSSSWHDVTELAVIICSCVLGVWSIVNALRNKAKITPQVFIVVGATIIVVSMINAPANHWIMSIGGGLLLLGHWQNQKVSPIGQ